MTPLPTTKRRIPLAGKISSAVICQALLSAANLLVGLILIRRSSNEQYGFYVLATNAITLLVTLQTSFFSPALNHRLSHTEAAGQAAVTGGFLREQQRLLRWLAGVLLIAVPVVWLIDSLHALPLGLLACTVVTSLLVLKREFFRTLLFAHHQPQAVLRTDALYALLLVAGVLAATSSPWAALAALAGLGLASLISAQQFARTLAHRHPWNPKGLPGLLGDMAPLAVWATAGAAIHWMFSQGYVYLVAGTLEVATVATLSATRLLMMPINLMSVGIGSVLMPLSARWLHQQGASVLVRRLLACALGMAAMTCLYFGLVWLLKDWIFAAILKKQFQAGDTLLLFWGAIMLLAVVRDQLALYPVSRKRFKSLAANTLGSALLSLGGSYLAMKTWGAPGALAGLLLGEIANLSGVALMIVTDPARRAGLAQPQ